VDLFYLHRDDTRVPVGEVMDSLNREVAAGRARYLGASNWSVDRIREGNAYAAAHGLQGFCMSQVQWSLATPTWNIGPDPTMRHVTPQDANAYAQMALPIAAYSATAGGYFARGTGGFDSPQNRERLQRARELSGTLGCTPTQLALAWLMSQEVSVIPIVGTLDVAHLAEALGAEAIALTREQVQWLAGA